MILRRQLRESRFFQNCGTFCFDLYWKYHNFERNKIHVTVFLRWTDFKLQCIHLKYITLYFVDSVHFLEPLYFEACLWHIHWYVFWLVFLDLPGFQTNLQMNWLKNCSFWNQNHHCWVEPRVFIEEVPICIMYLVWFW